MIFAAIDPGAVHAAIAVFHDDTPVFVDDIRTVNGMLDAAAFAHALQDMKVERIVVENVHAMPKQGVSSTFKLRDGLRHHPRRGRGPEAPADPCDPFPVEGLPPCAPTRRRPAPWPSESGRSTTATSTGKKTLTGPRPC